MLVELLHKVAVMEHQDEDERPYYHRPSMAGPDRCMRQMVYQARGQEKDKELPGRMWHVFNDGHWHEELTNEWIQKTAFTLHSQQMKVSVSMLGLTVSGKMDGILTDILGVDRIYEHKGYNHFTFERYWGKDTYPEDNFAQTAIYTRGAQEHNPDIRQAILVIKNKNTSAFLEYLLDYDRDADTLTVLKKTNHLGETIDLKEVRPAIVTACFQKFLAIDQHKAIDSLPDRPYDYDDWHCQYCAFQETCWASLKDEVESLAEEADLEPEMADTLRYYKEIGAQITDQEKEKEALRGKILEALKAKQAKKGKAGEYMATMNIVPTKRLDLDLVPDPLKGQLEPYKKEGWQTRLTIRSLAKKDKVAGPRKGKIVV